MMFSRISLMKWEIVYKTRTKKDGKVLLLVARRRKRKKLTNCCSTFSDTGNKFSFNFPGKMIPDAVNLFSQAFNPIYSKVDIKNRFTPVGSFAFSLLSLCLWFINHTFCFVLNVDCLMDWISFAPRDAASLEELYWSLLVEIKENSSDVSRYIEEKLIKLKKFDRVFLRKDLRWTCKRDTSCRYFNQLLPLKVFARLGFSLEECWSSHDTLLTHPFSSSFSEMPR